ncbi:Tubulointerstitial nephritis antigen-like [Branchiostoma belcheri]|nr:Tubulointerstitial nephritis antigen-like [Branchiostoma belcheri]
MSKRGGRRRHRRARARAAIATSSTFPACNVLDEPRDGHRLVFKAAMITMLLLVTVTTVVTETATIQWYYNNTAADTTSAHLPPYRSWGYSTGTDPDVAHNIGKMFPVKPGFGDDPTLIPDDVITNPGMPPVDEVRPPIQGPTVFGCSVQEEIDGVPDILKSWAFMTTDQRNVYLAMARLRIMKQIFEVLNREFDPEMMTQSVLASKMTQSALKPDTSTDEKTKGEMEKTEMAAEGRVLVENATETTTNATSHEGKHRMIGGIRRVEMVALTVFGAVVAAGSVAYSYSCTAQIT